MLSILRALRREWNGLNGEGRDLVSARGILIVAKRRAGLNTKVLSDITGLGITTISRRHDAAMIRMRQVSDLDASASKVIKKVSEL